MIIRFMTQIDEETAAKAKQVLSRHNLPEMSLSRLSEWAEHFGSDHEAVRNHIQGQTRLQNQMADKQKLDAIRFKLPPKLE